VIPILASIPIGILILAIHPDQDPNFSDPNFSDPNFSDPNFSDPDFSDPNLGDELKESDN
jgi:hypothetical protein